MKIKIGIFVFISFLVLTPLFTSVAAECVSKPDAANVTGLCNPIGYANSFQGFAVHVLQVFAGAASIAAIIFVLFSGFRFLTSQGNSETVEEAKRALQWALSGLILMLLSYVLVAALSSALKLRVIGPSAYTDKPNLFDLNPVSGTHGINNFSDVYLVLIGGFFEIMALVAVLILIINGVKYITSRGNEEQVESAKAGITYAVVGIVIALFAYVLTRATATFFGAT